MGETLRFLMYLFLVLTALYAEAFVFCSLGSKLKVLYKNRIAYFEDGKFLEGQIHGERCRISPNS